VALSDTSLDEMLQAVKQKLSGETVNLQWFWNEFSQELHDALVELRDCRETEKLHRNRFRS
jgi:hypothetical protein